MDFNLTENQQTIRDTILKVAGEFDDSYWLEKDKAGGFPEDFYAKFAEDGWLGICLLYTSPSPRDLSTSRMPSSA